MARTSALLNTFASGEINPKLHRRTDVAAYQSGLATLRNYLVMPEGGADRRRGFQHIGATKTPSLAATLIPFVFGLEQAYMLEAGDLYLRFYKDGARITAAPELVTNGTFDTGISGWTAIKGLVTWDASLQALRLQPLIVGQDAWVEQSIAIASVGVAHMLRFTVGGPVGPLMRVRIGTTSQGQEILPEGFYAAGFSHTVTVTPTASPIFLGFRTFDGRTIDDVSLQISTAAVVEVVTPYTEGALKDLQTTQAFDTLTLVQPTFAPRRLLRASHTSWVLQAIEVFDGPYLPENTRDTWTLVSSAASGTVTITAAGAGNTPFLAGHVGSTWTATFGTVRKSFRIQSFISSTQVTAFVLERIDDNGTAGFALVGGSFGVGFSTPTAVWAEGAWSTVRGFPTAVTQFESRVWYGGTATEPRTFWGTRTAEPYSMHVVDPLNPVADDAVTFTFSATKASAIRWLSPTKTALILGTTDGELAATGGPEEPITPTNIKVRPATSRGARRDRATPPVALDRTTLLVSRSGGQVAALEFSLDLESYVAPNVARRSAHLVRGPSGGGLQQLVFQAEPEPVLWGRRADGVLVAFTIEVDEQVFGWSQHPVGGTTAGPAVVEAAAVIPSSTGSADELWAITRRTVNGATRRDVERLSPESAVYVDAYLTYTGAPVSVLGGLDHLEGETVQVVGDGAVYPDQVVVGGQITVDPPVSTAVVGLACPARLQTLKLAVGPASGAGKKKSVSEVVVSLFESLGLTITAGGEGAKAQVIPFRDATDPLGTPPPPFTGDRPIEALGWDFDGQITLDQTLPLPSTVLAIAATVTVGEG